MTRMLWFALLPALLFASGSASAYYDPGVQRWINRDPIGEEGRKLVGDEGGRSLYDFVENEATRLYDSYGLLVGDDGSGGRVNPHRKKTPSCWDKHSKAQGRPKAGARPGKTKPNMAQNKRCRCGGAFLALYISICEMADMYPDCPPLPDENGNCPEPYTAVRHNLIWGFYYITCELIA